MESQESFVPACYVLTLDSPGGRRYESASKQLARFSIQPKFVNGIRFEAGETAPQYSPWLNMLCMKRRMTQGEISVYLGHRKIWEQILSDGHEMAMVFEDDFFIRDDRHFMQAIADAASFSHYWDIVKFFDFRPKRIIQSYRVNETDFVLHKYTGSGCVAYLIKAKKAVILLNQGRIFRPIDEDWSYPWEHNLRILSVHPNPIIEIAPELGGSLLECERLQMKKSSRNWIRSIYGNALTIIKTRALFFGEEKLFARLCPNPTMQSRKLHSWRNEHG